MLLNHILISCLVIFSVLAAAEDSSNSGAKKHSDITAPITQPTDCALAIAPCHSMASSLDSVVYVLSKNLWQINLRIFEPAPLTQNHHSELSLLKLSTPNMTLKLGLGNQRQADAALPKSLQLAPRDAGFTQNKNQEVLSFQFNF